MKAPDNNPGEIPLSFLPLADQGAKEAAEEGRIDGLGFLTERAPEAPEPSDPYDRLRQACFQAGYGGLASGYPEHLDVLENFFSEFGFGDLVHEVVAGRRKADQVVSGGASESVGALTNEKARIIEESLFRADPRTAGVPSKPGDDKGAEHHVEIRKSPRHPIPMASVDELRLSYAWEKQANTAPSRRHLHDFFDDCGVEYDPGCCYTAFEMRQKYLRAFDCARKKGWTPLPKEHGEQQHFAAIPLIWGRHTPTRHVPIERAHISVFVKRLGYGDADPEAWVLRSASDVARISGFRPAQGVDATAVKGVAEWWEREQPETEHRAGAER